MENLKEKRETNVEVREAIGRRKKGEGRKKIWRNKMGEEEKQEGKKKNF